MTRTAQVSRKHQVRRHQEQARQRQIVSALVDALLAMEGFILDHRDTCRCEVCDTLHEHHHGLTTAIAGLSAVVTLGDELRDKMNQLKHPVYRAELYERE